MEVQITDEINLHSSQTVTWVRSSIRKELAEGEQYINNYNNPNPNRKIRSLNEL